MKLCTRERRRSHEEYSGKTSWRAQKAKLLACAVAVILMLLGVAFMLGSTSKPAINLTYRYTTNHPGLGKMGVFQLVNHLNESVEIRGGFCKPAKRIGCNFEYGDWAPGIPGLREVAAGTTNIFQMMFPTNGGPYKLVVTCLPASKFPPEYHNRVRFRIVSFVSRWMGLSDATECRLHGVVFGESQSFEIPNCIP